MYNNRIITKTGVDNELNKTMNNSLKNRSTKHVNDTINYKNVELYVEHMSTAKKK